MDSKIGAVFSAILYSDLFSFPLTLSEIWQFTGSAGAGISKADCRYLLQALSPIIRERDGYYFLSGRERLVRRRITGQPHARKKLEIARQVTAVLSRIPTVQSIGVSGSLASGSTEPSADIDLFIITKKQTVFLTRFFVLMLLEVMRRRRGSDRVCLNMLMDETALALPSDRHDLYTAWEIARLRPLYDRSGMYRAFISRNRWVREYLPHFRAKPCRSENTPPTRIVRYTFAFLSLPLVESCCRRIQLHWVRRRQATDMITSSLAAFHPHDYRRETLRRYARKTQQYRVKREKKTRKTQPIFLDKGMNIFYTA